MKKYLVDYDKMLERELSRLKDCNLCKVDKDSIFRYHTHCISNGISIPRVLRSVSMLRIAGDAIGKPFGKAGREDWEKFFVKLKQEQKTDSTLDTYKATLKVFYKWFTDGETYPICIKWVKCSHAKSHKLPEELLTPEEVKDLIHSVESKRDKAFIAVLWESGARIGEVGTLEVRHVAFDDFGCQAMLNGKTGQRRIRLVSSAPYLLEWLNQHPHADNPNADLWPNIHHNLENPMNLRFINKLLRNAARKAGVKKPINPHHFRHSRATYMAQFLTEAQMKEYFGWVQDSDMAARYVHLSGKQVDDAILKMYGLKKEERKEDILKREPCPRCKNLNDVNHNYCEKCWLPLTPNATIETQTVEQKSQESAVSLMKLIELVGNNPEMLKQALTVIQQQAAGR